MRLRYVIAIDGPSGAGKSTLARELAKCLCYNYIDTGAMYRAAALLAARQGVKPLEGAPLQEFLSRLQLRQETTAGEVRTFAGAEDVSEAIRSAEMGLAASEISALPSVRARLLRLQRELGREGGVVMEGRDIGTVVFPDADFKFFLDATVEERARRRYLELQGKGQMVDPARILAEIRARDQQDSTRAIAPLRQAPDAMVIDSTNKPVGVLVEEMARVIGAGRGKGLIQGDKVLANGNNNAEEKKTETNDEPIAVTVAPTQAVQPPAQPEQAQPPAPPEQAQSEQAQPPAPPPEKTQPQPKPAPHPPARAGREGEGEEEGDDFGAMFEASMKRRESDEGEIIHGYVVSVHKDHVMVDIGSKSEGLVPIAEFKVVDGVPQVEVGQEIEVLVERRDEEDGILRLSKDKAEKRRVWDDLEDAFKSGEAVTGAIVEKVKGGLMVDIGVKAFLPGSQADLRPLRNLEKLLGLTERFQIIKFNRKRGNVVVSRRNILEKEVESKRSTTLGALEKDQVVKGVVKNITEYGAFIDLGGIDGLLHITDMSYGRINNPAEVLNVGDEITVKVLRFNRETEKVSLGLKQILPDPWDNVEKKYPIGTIVIGKVVSITDYGAFVELERGVEGLVHVSEMSWSKKRVHPSKILQPNQEVEAKVLDIDMQNRRISLSIKQAQSNPWDMLELKYPVGTKIAGKIRNITNFGVFVGVEEGIDGLVHISDLSWTKRVRHPSELFKKGQEVDCVVLKIDKEFERFSLGIKQVQPDPWDTVSHKYRPGMDVVGKVVNITDFGVFVELEEGIEGLIHISELSHDKVKDPAELVQSGQEITAEILNVDITERKIRLSIKALERAEQQVSYQKYRKQEGDGTSKLGELIQDKLSKMKMQTAAETPPASETSASEEAAPEAAVEAAPEAEAAAPAAEPVAIAPPEEPAAMDAPAAAPEPAPEAAPAAEAASEPAAEPDPAAPPADPAATDEGEKTE